LCGKAISVLAEIAHFPPLPHNILLRFYAIFMMLHGVGYVALYRIVS